MEFINTGIVDKILVDLEGRPIKRTPFTHPYSYDEFVLYKSNDYHKTDNCVYSDRLYQWDSEKFHNAVREVWPENPLSQMFYNKKPSDVEKFLSLYFDKPIKLTAIIQGCNFSSGYPYWVFMYKE